MPALTEAEIARLVAHFYAAIRRDPALGPIFEAAIGGEWDAHLEKLRRFWSAVMLRSGAYQGDPFTAHLHLPGLTQAHFDTWLALFERSCRDLFPDETAEAFLDRARRIARSLRMGIFERLPATAA
ncbi:group III truncated hemoglobin [Falsiroseomonas tokyonensis]|uniref:Group III truncated hemoglobin n=1 Tax=Falsiroseomonas tokyonensis TaxID=430521 RepID=A0ABV7BR42_9PROT|nr:group III truncated hemoglobin [Falsiroseomonas tokyonensis]MBU8536521.1 group III truncated hemoglobin [Falsiroseomonas tokyonensis]